MKHIAALLSAILLFAMLFYDADWGVNLLIFQMLFIGYFWFTRRHKLGKAHYALLLGALITSGTAFVYHSSYSFWVSMLALSVFATATYSSEVKSVHFVFLGYLSSSFMSYVNALRDSLQWFPRKSPIGKRAGKLVLYSLSFPVLAVFMLLYSAASPGFGELMQRSFGAFFDALLWIESLLNIKFLLFLFLGFMLLTPAFYAKIPESWINADKLNVLSLFRTRGRVFRQMPPKPLNRYILTETQFSTFLMISLIALISMVLFFEVRDVWFGFSWEGEMLKSFVHEGIWVLIISILVSAGIALFVFRKNQNFFSKALWLRRLMYVWLLLNAVLTVAVFVRTALYIEYFALAYRRIALLFFLVAVMIGLASIFYKIYKTKNTFFMWRVNAWSVYGMLMVMGLVNWDVLIAKYNTSHLETAFVELRYLKGMEDKALCYLPTDAAYLETIARRNKQRTGLDKRRFEQSYGNVEGYVSHIEQRQQSFLRSWPKKGWLSWNPAEAMAYAALIKQGKTNE